jgi:dihydroorotate dehydrogenase
MQLCKVGCRLGIFREQKHLGLPVKVMGLTFPNPVGLSAGLDKNGEYLDALATMGFGYIELGTVTPRPQPGNPKPRMFRLPKEEGVINRMGFNNAGVDVLLQNIQRSRYRGILGINIGKNSDTPIENAVDDYVFCLHKVYPYASYIVVNISSPNTQNLRCLQNASELDQLLRTLKTEQKLLALQYEKYVPLVVKIAPDLDEDRVNDIAQLLILHQIDGVISTNTTIARTGVENSHYAHEVGGLSGAPLMNKANQIQALLVKALQDKVPVIASGGIMRGQDAVSKIGAGAQLVQIYTGMVFYGPGLVQECVARIRQHALQAVVSDIPVKAD